MIRPDRKKEVAAQGADEAGRTNSDETISPEPTRPSRRRHPVRTSVIIVAATAVVAAGWIVTTGALGGGGSKPKTSSSSGQTAEVVTTTLTRSETVDGTLGYGETSSVQAAGGGEGAQGGGGQVITWLPSPDAEIKRGERVYAVNEDPVPLLYGSTPLYRTLEVGANGGDVAMLEQNLAALGYSGFTVDEKYTSATARAVRTWQWNLGREVTGKLSPGDAVIASDTKRVAEVKAVLGAAASGEILTWTNTERLVTVDLDTQYEDLVKEGAGATVKLPNGTQVPATVSHVGSVVTASSDGSGTATLPVTLSVQDQEKLGRYQAAPVDVSLTAESRENVLAVPINALVARRGGGYAVQAITDGEVELHTVKVGLFGNGMVEISGDGITEGMKVGIPQ